MRSFNNDYIERDDWCKKKTRTLLDHQHILGELAFDENNLNRNLLIFHGLGSGKTCTIIHIIELIRRQLLEKKKNQEPYDDYMFVISTRASVVESFKQEFSICPFTEKNPYLSNQMVTVPYKKKQPRERAKKIRQQLNREGDITTKLTKNNIIVLSHDTLLKKDFIDKIKNEKKPVILVIDEIQNFISLRSKRFKNAFFFVDFFLRFINSLQYKSPESYKYGSIHRTFFLSATPIKNFPNEISLMMTLLDISNTKYIHSMNKFIEKYVNFGDSGQIEVKQDFDDLVRNKISYFSSGHPNGFPMKRIITVEHEMHDYQEERYIDEVRSLVENLAKNRKNEEDIDPMDGIHEMGKLRILGNLENNNGKKRSKKLDSIIHLIKTLNGTNFIFTQSLETGQYLLDKLVKDDPSRYELWDLEKRTGQEETKQEPKKRVLFWHGSLTFSDNDWQKKVLSEFNSEQNIEGDLLKVIIGTHTVSEGISLKNVKNVHIVDYWWNNARIEQAIARSVRFGSHCSVLKSDSIKKIPTINIFKHVSIYSKNYSVSQQGESISKFYTLTFDQYLMYTSNLKNRLNHPFLKRMKEVAIDCSQMKLGNLIRLEEKWIPVRINDIDSEYRRLYYDPSGMKFYLRQIEDTIDKYSLLSFIVKEDFERLDYETQLQEYELSQDGSLVLVKDSVLEVGKDITPTLIINENISCK